MSEWKCFKHVYEERGVLLMYKDFGTGPFEYKEILEPIEDEI